MNQELVRNAVLGIDTSNYMTSVCLVDVNDGSIIDERRRLLDVDKGERGLQQSAALFQHVRHLPLLIGAMDWSGISLSAVGVSTRPRPQESSYMPVFLAGLAVAQSIGATHGIPVFETSHQEGHIAAGEEKILPEEGLDHHHELQGLARRNDMPESYITVQQPYIYFSQTL